MLGYFFIKIGVEPARLVLGPQLEKNFRRAMLLADGDVSVFFTSPISALILAVVAALLIAMVSPKIARKREEALAE